MVRENNPLFRESSHPDLQGQELGYMVKKVLFENGREEGIVAGLSGAVSRDGDLLKFSAQPCIPSSLLSRFSRFSLLTLISSRPCLIMFDISESDVSPIGNGSQVVFPKEKVLNINDKRIKVIDLGDKEKAGLQAKTMANKPEDDKNKAKGPGPVSPTSHKNSLLGKVCYRLLEQRIDECNQQLIELFCQEIFNEGLTNPEPEARAKAESSYKLSYEKILLGLRLLNAVMALKSIAIEMNSRPSRGLRLLLQLDPELLLVEILAQVISKGSIGLALPLIIRAIKTLTTNPKQSFMLPLLAFSSNQAEGQEVNNTKSILSIRDFIQRDYLVQVFEHLKNNVFQKIGKSTLNMNEMFSTLDVMLGWISVRPSSLGRLWIGRLTSNVLTNALMAYHIKEIEREDSELNPTAEALAFGKALFAEASRFLRQRWALQAMFAKL